MLDRLGRGFVLLGLLVSIACSESGPADTGNEGGEPNSDDGTPAGSGGSVPNLPRECRRDEECDDGDACNGEETCDAGRCQYGDAVNCNDGVACTRDSCDPESGTCEHRAPDGDNDGHPDGSCADADDVPLGDDCDDDDPGRFPGNVESCTVTFQGSTSEGTGDGQDEDCDPTTFGERDADGDGSIDAACFNVDTDGKRRGGDDCNDFVSTIHPNVPEVCDGFDNNCNGQVDEGLTVTRYEDPDGDGYGGVTDPESPDDPNAVILKEVEVCPGAKRVAEDETDCAPNDRFTAPNRDELCDGVDNDCDGKVDNDVVPAAWYRDFDRDGYGDPAGGIRTTCERIDHLGYSLYAGDCNDQDALVNPGQSELCDGKDNDCDATTTFWVAPGNGEDDDEDGAADPMCGTLAPDCNDQVRIVRPGAPELCDGIDNDCNGVIDTRTDTIRWYVDLDRDGFGDDSEAPLESCEDQASLVTRGGDCDDSEFFVSPSAKDDCSGLHGVDDDCDGDIDEGEALTAFYLDSDGDGYGTGSEPVGLACDVPANYVGRGGDCDDSSSNYNPGRPELCEPASTSDLNCNGLFGCADPNCASAEACEALSGLAMDASSPTTAFVSATFAATVILRNSAGDPVSGAPITISGPAGSSFPASAVNTDTNGRAAVTLGVGMKEGPYTFTVRAGSTGATKPINYTVTASLPPDGMVWSIVNRAAATSSGVNTLASFGPAGKLYYPGDIAVDAQGNAYVAGQSRIYQIDVWGQLTQLAGGSSGNGGDGGPASAATMYGPSALALDKARRWLYLASNDRVRVIDLTKSPPTIHLIAGGGAVAPPGGGPNVTLGASVYDLAVSPTGKLLISAANGFHSYEPTTGLVTPLPLLRDVTTSGPVVAMGTTHHVDWSERGLLMTGNFRGSFFGASQAPGAALVDSNSNLRHVFGAAGGGSLADGSLRFTTNVPLSTSSQAEFDSAGNVFFAATAQGESVNSLWRVDSLTGKIARALGTGTSSAGGEYVQATLGTSLGQLSFDVGPEGDLWLSEYSDPSRIRRIRGAAKGQLATASLSIESASGATYWPGEPLEPTDSLVRNGAGDPLTDVVVEQLGGVGWPIRTSGVTNLAGHALTSGYAEVSTTPATKSITVRIAGLDGTTFAEDTLSYQVVTPPAGTVTSWINADPTNYSQDTTDPVAPTGTPAVTIKAQYDAWSIATDDAGSTYWVNASYNQTPYFQRIYRVAPNGTMEHVAGGPGGNSGDGGPAVQASFIEPIIALHRASKRLFVASSVTIGGPKLVRVIDLETGLVDAFGGYGQDAAPGTAFLDTAPFAFKGMYLVEDTLFLEGNDFVYRVDLTQSNPTVEPFLVSVPYVGSSPTVEFYQCYYGGYQLCSIVRAPGGKYYMAGTFFGGGGAGTYPAIALLNEEGELERLVAGGPTNLTVNYPSALAIDAQGRLFIADRGTHTILRLDPPSGGNTAYRLSTVAGSNASSGFIDFVAAPSARFNAPRSLAWLPDGSLLVGDHGNHSVRRIWGIAP